MPQQQFKGYSEDQTKRIASKLGHTGDMKQFSNYLLSNPTAANKYNSLVAATTQRLARGGMVKSGYDAGGDVKAAYMKNFGRQPGEEALAFYTNELNTVGGKDLAQINADLAWVPEGKNYLASQATLANTTAEATGATTAATGTVAANLASLNASNATGNAAESNATVAARAAQTAATTIDPIGLTQAQKVDKLKADYVTEFGREIDTPGLDFYSGEMEGGKGYDDVLADLKWSEEGFAYHTDEEKVALANESQDLKNLRAGYTDEFGRPIKREGFEFYKDKMEGGASWEQIQAELRASEEGQGYTSVAEQAVIDKTAADKAAAAKVISDKVAADKAIADAKIAADLQAAIDKKIADDAKIAADLAAGVITAAEAAAAAAKLIADAAALAAKKLQDAKDLAASNLATATAMANSTALVNDTGITYTEDQTLGQTTLNQSLVPELAIGAAAKGTSTTVAADQLMDTSVGQVGTAPTAAAGSATASTADEIVTPLVDPFSKVSAGATDAQDDVKTAQTALAGETGTLSGGSKVTAQSQETSAVSALKAAQGTNIIEVDGAPTRSIQAGEEVSAVANAQTAAAFTEQVNAAQADPTSRATVQGQLATLMTSFDEGKTPAWAAGAMRNVTATMAARGIGSSSMAGQALIQAALESALPIATADAQTFASFEVTNLNNKQQRAMLAAQQRATFMGQEFDQEFQTRVFNSTRIGEIANMNFTATQQIAIENAQLANTVNLTNLSNKQAKVMAEAAALSQLDMANLSNRQQEQVQNAQSFLEMDMANLSNKQQTSMFKAQARVTAILSDTAAENARKQFNATSENQMDQFYQELTSQVSQFNASQKTAVSQFNAGEETTVNKFNADIKNQRDQFNAANSLVINQSNAQWRRTIATSDTATINRINEINAKSMLDISNTAYNNLWQEHRDEMDWTYQQSEGAFDRYSNLILAKLSAETSLAAANIAADAKTSSAAGTAIGSILTGNVTGTVVGKLLGIG